MEINSFIVSIITMPESNALEYIRKESLDIYNRIHSIEEDVVFVRQVKEEYPELPLLRMSHACCPLRTS